MATHPALVLRGGVWGLHGGVWGLHGGVFCTALCPTGTLYFALRWPRWRFVFCTALCLTGALPRTFAAATPLGPARLPTCAPPGHHYARADFDLGNGGAPAHPPSHRPTQGVGAPSCVGVCVWPGAPPVGHQWAGVLASVWPSGVAGPGGGPKCTHWGPVGGPTGQSPCVPYLHGGPSCKVGATNVLSPLLSGGVRPPSQPATQPAIGWLG